MIEFVTTNFNDRSYVLSGKKGTFYRYANSEFRNKWTGFWIYDLKIFDYFAIKSGDSWLSKDNIKRFYYNFAKAVHEYENGIEEIVVCENEPGMIIKYKTKGNPEFEIGINIRNKYENYKVYNYDIEQTTNKEVIINTGKEKVIIRVDNGSIVDYSYKYRTHYPLWNYMRTGFSRQDILQLNIKLDLKEDEIKISLNDKIYKKFEDVYNEKLKLYENVISYADNIRKEEDEIKKLVEIALLNLELLLKEKDGNLMLYAGYPWFLEMWGRDTAISLLAFIVSRRYDIVEKLLKTMKKSNSARIIPPKVTEDYISIDTPVFLLYSVLTFIDETKRIEYAPYVAWLLKKVSVWDKDKDGLLEVSNEDENYVQWMDSIKRIGKLSEVNAAWIKSLELMEKLFFTKIPHLNAIKSLFIKYNTENKIIVDSSSLRVTTPNSLPAIFLNIVNPEIAENTIKEIERNNLTNLGITTFPIEHPSFGSSEYHKGSSWWLTNFWYLMAKNTIGEDAFNNFFGILKKQVYEDIIFGFPENYDSINGKILGCGMQAWSAAMYIYYVAKYLGKKIK